MVKRTSPELLLRLGIAFTFLYAALGSFLEPLNWIGFFPSVIKDLGIPDSLLFGGFSVIKAGIALWLLWGKKLFIPSLGAAILLFGMVVVNLPAMDILFRDIGLAFAALALFVLVLRPQS